MGDAPPRVTVVVPTYNERPNLEELAGRVLALGRAYALLVVDDGSPDGTGALADRLAAASASARVPVPSGEPSSTTSSA